MWIGCLGVGDLSSAIRMSPSHFPPYLISFTNMWYCPCFDHALYGSHSPNTPTHIGMRHWLGLRCTCPPQHLPVVLLAWKLAARSSIGVCFALLCCCGWLGLNIGTTSLQHCYIATPWGVIGEFGVKAAAPPSHAIGVDCCFPFLSPLLYE